MPFFDMDDVAARRWLWFGVAALLVELVAVAQVVELHQLHWGSPCRMIGGLALLAVVAVLLVAVHMLARP